MYNTDLGFAIKINVKIKITQDRSAVINGEKLAYP